MRIDRRTLLKLFPASLFWRSAGDSPAELARGRAPRTTPLRKRARDLGIRIGSMQPGMWNAITDVPGVRVGHSTLIQGQSIRTGVTVVVPHDKILEEYIPFGFHILNGNGEVSGLIQGSSLGILASPVCLTNTSSVGMVYDALLSQMPDKQIVPIVGETWDAYLNDIEGRHVHKEHVWDAWKNARSGPVTEGNVGGGTGMICYEFKGGIGTASRRLPDPWSGYTVGALVQANHGSREHLRIDGVPVGEEIHDLRPVPDEASFLNSILIVIATDAPLLDYQLNRIARRGGMGLAKSGSIASNSSGDFIVAFSTTNRIKASEFWKGSTYTLQSIEQYDIQPLFEAAAEATEEAIINALFMAGDLEGYKGHKVFALPIDRTLKIMERHHRLFRSEERKVASV
ncbi:P1 family peptidase [bacterium]|nr:P1 family peptidase [bacterium]